MGERLGLPGPTDAWITLAGLARDTTRIRLGTLVTSATFRLPGPLAITVAQVDAMSGGRVELGLGAGWYEAEHKAYAIPFPPLGERFERLEEQLAIISGLWSTPEGGTFSFDGKHYPRQRLTGTAEAGAGTAPADHRRRRRPQAHADARREVRGRVQPAVRADRPLHRAVRSRAAPRAKRSAATRDRSCTRPRSCCAAARTKPRSSGGPTAIGRDVDELRKNGAAGTPAEVVETLQRWQEARRRADVPADARPVGSRPPLANRSGGGAARELDPCMGYDEVTDLRALLHHTADHAADFLESLDDRSVAATASYEEMVAAFEGDVPEEGRDATEVIDDLARRAAPGLEGMPSARYFGFVIGGHLDAALAADNLTAAWDQNTTLAAATPAAAACEEVVGRQLASVLGLPEGVSFALVTGGMMANFTALAAARHSVLRAHGWDHEIDGLQGAPRVRLVVGAERHSTIDRSLRYLGFGSSSIEVVEADSQGSMRPESLARVLSAQPKGPTIVCAQAGNVNSGGFDPFGAICDIAHEHGAWVHIDGAFGLWAAASRNHRHLVDGFELADSWATDAHKWLNVPYDCGIAFTAHPADHAARSGSARTTSCSATAGATRRTSHPRRHGALARSRCGPRSQSLGTSGVAELVDRCCERAQQFASALREIPGVEVANDVVINQIVVRFPGLDGVLEAVSASGACVVTPTALARSARRTDLGVELADDRARHRDLGGRDQGRWSRSVRGRG